MVFMSMDASAVPDLFDGSYKAFLFDLDGVITDTASVHAAAWKAAFDDFLSQGTDPSTSLRAPFDIGSDYPLYVDGKPRNKGVRDFLTSRSIELPEGNTDDPAGYDTVWAVGNLKNERLVRVIAENGVEVYDGTVQFVNAARTAGIKTAVVSSSANTAAVLKATNLDHLFEVRVDGVTILDEQLSGKPSPDTFLLAASRLGVHPDNAVVFEDALAGVEAGRRGNFGLVVGVDRIGHAAALKERGADIVVTDLAELLGRS